MYLSNQNFFVSLGTYILYKICAMDKDYQNTGNILEVTGGDEAKKPEHAITAEISIEVTGENGPTKYDKHRERWVVVAMWSFVAFVISALLFTLVDVNIYSFYTLVISTAVWVFSSTKSSDINPEDTMDTIPWYYSVL